MLSIVNSRYRITSGDLTAGCVQCLKGEKLVLFVTGLCPATCYFCPLSEQRKMNDVCFANETPILSDEDLLEEARMCDALGAGITGGDPLTRLERTCHYIRSLKREFGEGFHIHLYTPLILVNERTLDRLAQAGLDEIRFHPSLESKRLWDRIKLARKHPWRVGLELPVFPDKLQITQELLEFAAPHIDFVNLNELEITEITAEAFRTRGYKTKDSHSHAIQGSRQCARILLERMRELDVPAHFCTCTLKDKIQVGNRLRRRAGNAARPFDIVDSDGLLTRGAIYKGFPPTFGYQARIAALDDEDRREELERLGEMLVWLRDQGMPQDGGALDPLRLRILLSAEALRDLWPALSERFDARCYIVKEYPTSDAFPTEMELLG